jgi:hypothetical protein
MGGRERVQKFFKSVDRFTKPITLSYMRKKQYTTTVGGICTLIMWIFFFTVAVSRIHFLFFGLNQYVESAQTNIAAGTKEWAIPPEEFTLTNII